MRNKLTAGVLCLTLCLLTLCTPVFADKISFTDVPANAWEAPYVYELASRKVVSGFGDGTFGPNLPVQRCEYAKMLVGLVPLPLSESLVSPYADVPRDQWYFPYVNSCLKYIPGYTVNGTLQFRPEWDATREDVATALVKVKKINLEPYSDAESYLRERFSDVDTISTHNRIYIAAAVDKGYLTGDQEGTFRGSALITRAEVSAILCRAFPRK
ncbi:MAG: S-layer homology domain-containing protein [Clostridia bacterium]|nr:S-layer homology domain-containing protein [Clostridia bacterium]